MNKKLLAFPLFLCVIMASLAYAVKLYSRDIEGTFEVNKYYELKITWANGTENPRFDLGHLWIGESKVMPAIAVTMLGDGAYVRWLYVGVPELYVSCYEVDEGGNVYFKHGDSHIYTFCFWLKNALETGTYGFVIRLEVNDVIT